MKLTGKFKDGLYEWLQEKSFIFKEVQPNFGDLPQSAQFGLIEEYCDTLGVRVGIYFIHENHTNFEYWVQIICDTEDEYYCKSRAKAQLKALEKVQEIINSE